MVVDPLPKKNNNKRQILPSSPLLPTVPYMAKGNKIWSKHRIQVAGLRGMPQDDSNACCIQLCARPRTTSRGSVQYRLKHRSSDSQAASTLDMSCDRSPPAITDAAELVEIAETAAASTAMATCVPAVVTPTAVGSLLVNRMSVSWAALPLVMIGCFATCHVFSRDDR